MGRKTPNRATRDTLHVGSLMIDGTLVFKKAGAPTDGTSGDGAGAANPGSILIDTTNYAVYKNVNTKASPTWLGEGFHVKNTTVTTAQVLALNATPISLVAAPGANKALIFRGAMISKAAGVAYAGIAAGEDLAIKYTDGSGLDLGQVELTGFLDQTTAQFRFMNPVVQGTAPVSSFTPVANAALVAQIVVGEIITGDSDLKFRVFYQIVPTVL